jgi:hypothetical protein
MFGEHGDWIAMVCGVVVCDVQAALAAAGIINQTSEARTAIFMPLFLCFLQKKGRQLAAADGLWFVGLRKEADYCQCLAPIIFAADCMISNG